MNPNQNNLSSLPPPPKGQMGVGYDSLAHLPPPPKGQQGVSFNDIQPQDNRDFLQKAGDAVSTIFPGKQLGEGIGNSLYGISQGLKGNFSAMNQAADENNANAPKMFGDAANAGLFAGAMATGGGTALGRVSANAAVGAGLGATNAISQGQSGGDIAKNTVVGGALGGGLSAAGELGNYLTKNMPQWFTKLALPKLGNAVKGTPEETVNYALNNTKGATLKSMYSNSNSAIKSYENQVQAVLSHPQYANETGNLITKEVPASVPAESGGLTAPAKDTSYKMGTYKLGTDPVTKEVGLTGEYRKPGVNFYTGGDKRNIPGGNKIAKYIDPNEFIKNNLNSIKDNIVPAKETSTAVNQIKSSFPNSSLNDEKIVNIVKQVAPQNKALVDKVIKGTANLQEQNVLRKELDQATKAAYGDKPNLTFAKQIGKSMADFLRGNVQGTAKETAPIFSEYSKEHTLNKALGNALSKKRVAGPLVAGAGGFASGGLKGAAEAIALEEGIRSPAVRLGVAKGIQALGKTGPALGAVTNAVKAPLIRKATRQ